MSASVTIKPFIQIVKALCHAKREYNINVPIYVHGKHGIGKTTIMEAIANEISYNFVVLNLANQTPDELLGYPDKNGGYILPSWFQRNMNAKNPTLYFLDEINRAPKHVLQAMFNFINEGRIHEARMQKFDMVVAAGNPDDENYEVVSFEDKAFVSRFAHFYMSPSMDEYIDFLRGLTIKIGDQIVPAIHESVITTLKESPDFCTHDVLVENRLNLEPDNRAIHKIGVLLNLWKPEFVNEYGVLVSQAMVGQDFTTVLMKNYQNWAELPTPEEILLSKKGEFKKRFKSEQLDMIHCLNSNVTKYMIDKYLVVSSPKEGKFDTSVKQIKTGLIDYMKYIPADARVAFMSELKSRVGTKVPGESDAKIKPASIIVPKLFETIGEDAFFDELMECQKKMSPAK